MDKDTQNIIATQMASLPKEVRDAIVAVDYPRKLEAVAKSNKLLIDQAAKLETETTLVMLGLEPLNDYIDNLVRELELPKDKVILVAKDVDELIFKNIRESLKKINEEGIKESPATPASATAIPTKEDILSGIEKPHEIRTKEPSISVSSLSSNNPAGNEMKANLNGIEVHKDLLPEIRPEAILPPQSKVSTPYHENIAPVENIVASKMTETIVVPKQTIVVEEKTKLPEKKTTGDPYREPIL